MEWTEATTARDEQWDTWAHERYGVEYWEQLDPEQVAEMWATT